MTTIITTINGIALQVGIGGDHKPMAELVINLKWTEEDGKVSELDVPLSISEIQVLKLLLA